MLPMSIQWCMAVLVYVLVYEVIRANPAGIASGKAMDLENIVAKLYKGEQISAYYNDGRGFKATKETRTCYAAISISPTGTDGAAMWVYNPTKPPYLKCLQAFRIGQKKSNTAKSSQLCGIRTPQN